MKDDSTPRDPLAAKADALEKALADLEAKKQAAAALAAKNAPQIERIKALEAQLAGLSQGERREVLDAVGMSHISAAPPPIERVRSSGPMRAPAVRSPRASAPIAWVMWLSVPKVELWEGVALVLDINPKALQFHRAGWMGGGTSGPFFEPHSFPSQAKHEEFLDAMSFAKKATGYQSPIAIPMGYPASGNSSTDLRDVVAYFVSCEWPDIPAPLMALVSAAASTPADNAAEAVAAAAPSIAVEPTTPPSLTTPDIAEAFDGIYEQTAKQWRNKLGDVNNHQWLVDARAEMAKAPKPAKWWPIKFAKLLIERGASAESLNRAFLKEPKLKPWLVLWQENQKERNAFGQ